jgi:hypothetical protein
MNRRAMTFPNGCLFGKTALQCRLVGARGGRARARNLQLHRAAKPAAIVPPAPEPEKETAHEASETLDRLFPHLAGAFAPRPTKRDAILALLRRDDGATITEITQATGWPRRTARAFRSVVGREVRVERVRRPDGTPAYIAA